MGCNTSQEQPQSTLNVNTEADNADDGGSGVKQSLDGPTVPSSTASDKKNSSELANETVVIAKGKDSEESSLSSPPKDRTEDKPPAVLALQDENEEEDEEKAAVKIQAAFRGHKVRTDMKKGDAPEDLKTKQKEQQKEATSADKMDDDVSQELDEIFDPNDKELCDAATKIQATFRGHLQRKLATGAKDQLDIDEITKKVAEELDIDLTDPELNKAATKIQASFRGHKTRKGAPAN